MYLIGFVKRWLPKLWKQANSATVTKYKSLPSPPLCFGHTTANHPPTAHCWFTLFGDQKQTIIQAHSSAGKIAKASYTVDCEVSLIEATYSNCSQSMETTTLPTLCFWHTTQSQPPTVRTVPRLLGNAGLDGKRPAIWVATLMAWATPVLKRKLLQPPSKFAQIYMYNV